MKKHLEKIRFKIHQLKNKFRGPDSTPWKKIKYIILGLILFFAVVGFSFFSYIYLTLPDIDDVESLFAAQASVIYDRNGEVLYTIQGDENRKNVDFEAISKYAGFAVIAMEDDKFYDHAGFDFAAILKALCSEVGVCSQARGGSTITQQYIKNTFLSSERSYVRKAKEILLSMQLEKRYNKDEILALYLNRIPYGSNIYGVEVASQTFFGKPAVDLSIAESAILAALPKAPSYYFPYGENVYARIELESEMILENDFKTEEEIVEADTDFIIKGLLGKTYTFGEGEEARDIYVSGRVNFVLDRMKALGFVTEEEWEVAIEEANNMEFKPLRQDIEAPHFVMYVRQLLEEQYETETIQSSGFRITTTLDMDMQKMAEESIDKFGQSNQDKYGASNSALISVDPNNGQILAMVGSRDYWNDEISGKDNVTVRKRAPGSSFKPMAYAAAYLAGYAPSAVVYDVKTTFGGWTPNNYDGRFKGPVTMRSALGSSLNIPAIKAAHLAGLENVEKLARDMGIDFTGSADEQGLTMSLGTGPARPLDMALGYSVFANGGERVEPVSILKIEDMEGNIIFEYETPKNEQVLDPEVAYLMNDSLSDTSSRPAGYWRDQLSLPGQVNGAKTGTSNVKDEATGVIYPQDNWTIGYVRNLVTAVWSGNNDGSHLNGNATGLGTASPIWKDYMTKAVNKVEKADFEKPEGIKWVRVSRRSGKLPSKSTPSGDTVSAVFASFSVPTEYDTSYQLIKIDKVSGKLATEFTPKEAIEEKAFFTHHSILRDNQQWESAVRAWARASGQDDLPPTEYDDVHTAETMDVKPQITITSPKSMGKISPPQVAVMVDVSSPAGIDRVEYYFNDELVSTSTKAPFTGNINLSPGLKDGSTHSIRAVVYDEILRSNQSSIKVKVGTDDTPPKVSFVYPTNGSKLTAGSSVGIQLEAYDADGAVASVRYYLDGKLQKNQIVYPFDWQFQAPEKEGKYILKVEAFDHANNKGSDSITITVVEKAKNNAGSSGLISPANNSFFDEGDSVNIQALLSDEDQKQVSQVTFMAKKAGQSSQVIGTVKGNKNTSNYSVVWDSPPSGTYELYIKVVTESDTKFSGRVNVVVGNE